ncbi:MAG: hypothetical protein ACLSTO_01705 [Bilophila wadsworthia]
MANHGSITGGASPDQALDAAGWKPPPLPDAAGPARARPDRQAAEPSPKGLIP